jgi:ferredoxin
MIRQIIKIDEEKCVGCGLCVNACHEGAIGLVDGKAKLLRDDYCDGLGNCLPSCPTKAITFEEREADAYNEEAVKAAVAANKTQSALAFSGCPGTRAAAINRNVNTEVKKSYTEEAEKAAETELRQWPVQIKLVPVNAPYWKNANLLVAADCTAYAYGNFHSEYMKNRITIIGCPKLDEGDYAEKFTAILQQNDIKSVTVVRMEVPCCGGIEHAVKTALQKSGKMIPWQIVTISTDGRILED